MATLEEWIADRLVEATEDPDVLKLEERMPLQDAYPVDRAGAMVDVMRNAMTLEERAQISEFLTKGIVETVNTLADILRHQASFDLETMEIAKRAIAEKGEPQ